MKFEQADGSLNRLRGEYETLVSQKAQTDGELSSTKRTLETSNELVVKLEKILDGTRAELGDSKNQLVAIQAQHQERVGCLTKDQDDLLGVNVQLKVDKNNSPMISPKFFLIFNLRMMNWQESLNNLQLQSEQLSNDIADLQKNKEDLQHRMDESTKSHQSSLTDLRAANLKRLQSIFG